MFYRSKNTFIHYDSGHGMNSSAAKKCAVKLTPFISGDVCLIYSLSAHLVLISQLRRPLRHLSIVTKILSN